MGLVHQHRQDQLLTSIIHGLRLAHHILQQCIQHMIPSRSDRKVTWRYHIHHSQLQLHRYLQPHMLTLRFFTRQHRHTSTLILHLQRHHLLMRQLPTMVFHMVNHWCISNRNRLTDHWPILLISHNQQLLSTKLWTVLAVWLQWARMILLQETSMVVTVIPKAMDFHQLILHIPQSLQQVGITVTTGPLILQQLTTVLLPSQ